MTEKHTKAFVVNVLDNTRGKSLTLFEIQAIAQAKNISTGDIREALRDLTRTGIIVAADERLGNTTVIIKTFSIKKEEESMSFRA